jgi:HSP20 family molecular chaperone IbpA
MWMVKLKNSSFNRFGSEFATLIDKNHFLGRSSLLEPWYKNEEISMEESGKEHLYRFIIPVEGYTKEELHLELSGKFLKITGSKEVNQEIKNNFISLINKNLSFEQIFELSDMVNQDEIQAMYDNETLILTFSSNTPKERKSVEEININ